MTKQNAIILSIAIAAGAAYIFTRRRSSEAQTGDQIMEHDLAYDQSKRGYRNNNPLNIRINPGNNWKGKILANTDGVFEQFISMPYGFRAALVLFRNYIRKGDNTLAKIVAKWAPPTENHTGIYTSFVANKTGIDPERVIKRSDAESLKLLAHAMAWYENGSAPQWTDIEEGWEMV